MVDSPLPAKSQASGRIWWFAFGYFASYVPYSLLAKGLSSKDVEGGTRLGSMSLTGDQILPLATVTSVIGMIIFLSVMRWWPYATQVKLGRLTLPRPRLVTGLSGVATAVIVITTTLAYTFEGVSVVFAMLLMRGGVLLMAPLVDRITGRPFRSIPWWSWVGSGLALVALLVKFTEDAFASDDPGSTPVIGISLAAGINIAFYLAAYFFRLRWMSNHAKGDAAGGRERRIAFFVEEQMVATPLALAGLVLLALVLPGHLGDDLRFGFVGFWEHLDLILLVVACGLFSQFSGVFGALVLLEPQENAFTVPVNRASSVLSGLAASVLLAEVFDGTMPSVYEFVGAGIIIVAILVLSYPSLVKRPRTP